MLTLSAPERLFVISNVVAWTALLVMIWRLPAETRRRDLWLAGGLLAFILAAGRWPVLFYPQELNIDESQMIAQAMRFRIAPIPWLHVDGTTSGPLNSYWLIPPAWLGLPLGYASARLMGLVALWTWLWFALQTARAYVGLRAALLLAAPFLVLVAFTRYADFAHYSSEHLPLAMLSGQLYLCARVARGDAASRLRGCRWALAAVSAAIPFTKLQAAPVAVAMFGIALGIDGVRSWRQRSASASRRALAGETLLPYVGGAAAVVALLLGPVIVTGAFYDFLISYLWVGATYGSGSSDRLGTFTQMLVWAPAFTWLAAAVLMLTVGLLVLGFVSGAAASRAVAGFGAIVVAQALLTVFVVTAAGRPHPHYLLLLLLPLFHLPVVAWAFCGSSPRRWATRARVVAALACLAAVAHLVLRTEQPLLAARPNAAGSFAWRPEPISDAGKALVVQARPGETLAVWGWEPRIYVESGLPPATRDSLTWGAMNAGPYQAYFLQRFIGDFMAARPKFFVDAVRPDAFGFNERQTHGHEQFPALDRIIRRHYRYYGEVGAAGRGYRFYVLTSPVDRAP